MKNCKSCNRSFKHTSEDLEFYAKINVPEPKLCPLCREQRRLVWRNEWQFYKNKCAKTGQPMISYISPDKPIKVYNLDEWLSDSWNGLDFGQEFDFKRPFFEQFNELLKKVPHIPLLVGDSENCEYTNYSWGNKNCYLISAADLNEECYYAGYLFRSRNCLDCLFVNESELSYECTDCEKCYEVFFSQRCRNSQNLYYSYNCLSCKECIGCVNLVKKSYCIVNQQYSKEEYEKKKQELLKTPDVIKSKVNELKRELPDKYAWLNNCEKCFGNNLTNCKDCFYCFDLIECEKCRYVTYGIKSQNCMDINGCPSDELCYETVASPDCYNVKFSSSCWVKSSYLTYCYLCRASQYCFGCIGMYRNKYCILNKQYSQKDYEELVPKIIDHMKKTGEWGEFFPSEISPWDYNETVAQDYYPLSKEEILSKGMRFKIENQNEYKSQTYIFPKNIQTITDTICDEILACEKCSKNYKIIKQELSFYKKYNLNVPTLCAYCRHKSRLALRQSHKLFKRNCSKCAVPVDSSYNTKDKAEIYCEKCYLQEVY